MLKPLSLPGLTDNYKGSYFSGRFQLNSKKMAISVVKLFFDELKIIVILPPERWQSGRLRRS